MKRIAIAGIAGLLVAAVIAYTQYHKPHKDYAAAKAVQTWQADELVTWYNTHPESEHGQWLEKVVIVEGEVSSTSGTGVVLSPGVVVALQEGSQVDESFKGNIKIKGRIVGFDDLFGEVRLDHGHRLP